MPRIIFALLVLFWALPARADDSGVLGQVLGAIRTVVNFIKGIYKSITNFIEWVGKLLKSIFEAAWNFITDAFVWLFDKLFGLAADLLNGVADTFGLDGIADTVRGLWSALPPVVVQVTQAIGLSTAVGIIVTALLIRFALQLIPFVRLGS